MDFAMCRSLSHNVAFCHIHGTDAGRIVQESTGQAWNGVQTFTYAVKALLDSGELVPILRDWTPARYPFNVVYPPNRKLSIRMRTFIDWLLEIFESLD
jgi:DNA-binding transcriptional LysR family regulator